MPVTQKTILACGLALVAGFSSSHRVNAELPAESVPNVATLTDASYTDSLLFVHDPNFDALIAGRVVLLDVALANRNYKGALDAAQFASFIESSRTDELYVAETFYSRGTRGQRSDVLTIYDKHSLVPIDEVFLPGGRRGLYVAHRYTLQLINRDKFLLVFNFSPAASVTLVDLVQRKILSETPVPGCGLVYPAGRRGFAALCSNGSVLAVQFDTEGQVVYQEKLPAFFDVDADPLFDKPVYIGKTAWFPSFKGDIQALDLSDARPKVGVRWSLLTPADRQANWRPGGWQIASVDDAGQIYVLMHPDGADGTHKAGGAEVWVFNPARKQRLKRVALKHWGVSIEVTRGRDPYLVVTNADMQLDIYQADSGQWLKMIGGAAAMPFNLHARR